VLCEKGSRYFLLKGVISEVDLGEILIMPLRVNLYYHDLDHKQWLGFTKMLIVLDTTCLCRCHSPSHRPRKQPSLQPKLNAPKQALASMQATVTDAKM